MQRLLDVKMICCYCQLYQRKCEYKACMSYVVYTKLCTYTQHISVLPLGRLHHAVHQVIFLRRKPNLVTHTFKVHWRTITLTLTLTLERLLNKRLVGGQRAEEAPLEQARVHAQCVQQLVHRRRHRLAHAPVLVGLEERAACACVRRIDVWCSFSGCVPDVCAALVDV